jgi:hypothetical protein
MSCHIAGAIFPLHGRIRETHAKHSGGILNDSLTAGALFHDRVAAAAVELTAFLGHEDAIMPFS